MERFLNGLEYVIFYGPQEDKFLVGLMVAITFALVCCAFGAACMAAAESWRDWRVRRSNDWRVRRPRHMRRA